MKAKGNKRKLSAKNTKKVVRKSKTFRQRIKAVLKKMQPDEVLAAIKHVKLVYTAGTMENAKVLLQRANVKFSSMCDLLGGTPSKLKSTSAYSKEGEEILKYVRLNYLTLDDNKDDRYLKITELGVSASNTNSNVQNDLARLVISYNDFVSKVREAMPLPELESASKIVNFYGTEVDITKRPEVNCELVKDGVGTEEVVEAARSASQLEQDRRDALIMNPQITAKEYLEKSKED